MAIIPVEPIWVDDQAELESLCLGWRQQAAIAVDTEFMRSTTFYPRAALFQVGDGKGCYLIDPLAIADLTALREVLLDPGVTKVMHSCSEDLEVLQTFMQVIPTPLLDTQVAAAFAGRGFSLGYAALVDTMLGVAIPKSETRSDWLQRPLSQSQKQYAALDVAYLLVVYGMLLKQLREQQRLDWVEQECASIVAQAQRGLEPEQYYRKIKLAWKLNATQLAVLQRLATWREAQARARDVPRNRLVKENALWELAARMPQQVREFKAIDGIPPRVIRSDGESLLSMIAQASETPQAQCPPPLPPPLTPRQSELLKQLRARVRQVAEQLGIAAEVLARKKDFEDLIRSLDEHGHYQLNEALSGWRKGVIGQQLLELLSSPDTNSNTNKNGSATN